MFTCFCFYIFQLTIVYCISIGSTCCYAADFALLVNSNLIIDCGQAANHEYRCTNAVLHACPAFSEYQLAGVVADGLNALQVFVQRQTFFVDSKVYFAFFQVYRNCIVCSCVNSDTVTCGIFSINSIDSVFQSFVCFLFIQGYIITGNQGSMLTCFGCYFLQLLFGCSFTGSCKASISSSFIAKSAYGCSSAIHNNIASYYTACCYTAACPDSAVAATDAYHCAIIAEKMNIVIQSNFIFLATVFIGGFSYSNIITIGNSTVFECFCFYIFQLAIVYCIFISFTICYAADFTGIVDTNNTIDCGAAIHHNYRFLAVGNTCNTCSQGYAGISINYTGNIFQFTGKFNFYIVALVANSNILMTAGILFTAEINGCFRCYLICCTAFSRKLPAFIGICSCFFQLAYVYCIGICFACCYIDNLTVSASAAYEYCISSVSYAANAQSNSAFTGTFGIMTENNSVINSCFG